jgi:hypothetical protein
MALPPEWPLRTAREAIAAAVFLGVLALQVLIPLSRLAEPRPARFAWHMYSGARAPVAISVMIGTDSVHPIELRDVVRNVRADLDYVSHLVPHLCGTLANASGVRVARGAAAPEYVPCD